MISPGVHDEIYSWISTRVASEIMLMWAQLLESIYSLEMRTLYYTTTAHIITIERASEKISLKRGRQSFTKLDKHHKRNYPFFIFPNL